MPNSYPRDQIESSLSKKGFVMRETDHRIYTFKYNEKETSLKTKISKGSGYKDYGISLLDAMKRTLKLPLKSLKGLIECPLDEEG